MSNQALAIREDMSLSEIGNVFVKSGFFSDTRDASQAIVKILAGREFGFGPFSSMTGVYIIQGRPSLAANLMAAAVKRSGRYDYRVREMTEVVCDVEFFERVNGEKPDSLGHSRFTMDDAKKAGTKNLDKYPRNMLFARAMSNGVKWYCPDVFNGSAVYTPDELGADVDEEGRVIEGQIIPPVTATESTGDKQEAASETQAESKPLNGSVRPYTADVLRAKLIEHGNKEYSDKHISKDQIGLLAHLFDLCFSGHDDFSLRRHAIQMYLFGVESLNDAPHPALYATLNAWLMPKKDSGGEYRVDAMAVTEANIVYAQALKDQGQLAMPL